MTSELSILFPLYNGVTQLDFTGPHQVLQRMSGARLTLASLSGEDVTSDDGITFGALQSLRDIPACDIIVVPGGMHCVQAMQNTEFLTEIRRLARTATYVTSVCSGSLILGAAGLLQGKKAASHWFWRDLLDTFGAIPDPARIVQDGSIFTGGGVTAGIDFALALVADIRGAEEAQSIQLKLEYAPAPPFDAGRFETAPQNMAREIKAQADATLEQRRNMLRNIQETAKNEGFFD